MTHKRIALFCKAMICFFACSLFFSFSAAAQKEITLEDIWLKGTFRVSSVPGFNVMNNGSSYVKQESNGDIAVYDLKSNKQLRVIFDKKSNTFVGEAIAVSDFAFSADEKQLMLLTDAENIYRRSVLYKVYVFDIASKKIQLLDAGKVLHPSFSPDGTKVAFVKNNNIFYKDLASGQVTTVTTSGEMNKIINGNCDWVYEEEFEFTQAYQWSPAGNYLAYYTFDESQVKEYTIPYYEGKDYPRNYTYKYPKAGEANSLVSIHTYNIHSRNTANADLGPVTDQYIPRIKWSNRDDELCIYRLNRLQNQLDLLLSNAESGISRLIYNESNQYYLEINDNLTFLNDNQSFIFNSEKSGYNQLYKWNWVSSKLSPITTGTEEVKDLLGVDLNTNKIYYTATDKAINNTFNVIDLNGKNKKVLSQQSGTHEITVCNGFKYFVDKYNTANQVPVFTLLNNKGKVVRVLEDNSKLQQTLAEYQISKVEFMNILNESGEALNAYMIKPANFDASKKYPVLMYQYSGPGSQQVINHFPMDNFWWHQLLAQKGYIIVVADGTGTGGRGEAFKKKTYLQLGKYESDDQIAVAKYLAKQSYVDAARIGIWGWSYGGFMSTTCLFKAPDVFKTAIAVAPVTNWRYYDNIYTERYMRTPKENEKGYDDNAPLSMVKNLKGNFLLVHGTADDNVHLQNAAELSNALVNANKDFDAFYYTNKNHGIYGGYTRYNLYKKMTAYLLKNL